jgi:hypothetical protein
MVAGWFIAASLWNPALAADVPDIRVQDDGSIVAHIVVDASVRDVRKAISDGLVDVQSLTNVLSVKTSPDGECHRVERTTRGLFTPLAMRTRFCPTPDGWREYLVQSDSYEEYSAVWTVTPTADGSEIMLKVRSDVNFYIPDGLMRAGTVQGLNETFAVLLKRLLAGNKAR